ncbi:MAG: hypothetical protein M1820_000277 [Bogoriella megaspora]|nr:MAG: hypothetical protein M1820_000277 [Bogoriella megaspora]
MILLRTLLSFANFQRVQPSAQPTQSTTNSSTTVPPLPDSPSRCRARRAVDAYTQASAPLQPAVCPAYGLSNSGGSRPSPGTTYIARAVQAAHSGQVAQTKALARNTHFQQLEVSIEHLQLTMNTNPASAKQLKKDEMKKMGFLDLPEKVREQIYELHLLNGEAVDWEAHHDKTIFVKKGSKKEVPLLQADYRLWSEAALIYYGKNHFEFPDTAQLNTFLQSVPKHDLVLIRAMTFAYDVKYSSCYSSYSNEDFTDASEAFGRLLEASGLEDLKIKVDEVRLVKYQCSLDAHTKRFKPDQHIPEQINMKILSATGMNALRRLRCIKKVTFISGEKTAHREWGGPIPGGVFETTVAREMMMSRSTNNKRPKNFKFRFMSLPPELRNRIYGFLFTFEGGLIPIREYPTACKKPNNIIDNKKVPHSALSLLAANKQIHDEAVGIFYRTNHFIFVYPLHAISFLHSIGSERKSHIREVTIWHKNYAEGGLESMDLLFSLISRLPTLKALHLVLDTWGSSPRNSSLTQWGPTLEKMDRLAGLETLKTIRGLEEFTVRALWTECYDVMSKKERDFRNGLVREFTDNLKKAMRVGKGSKVSARKGKPKTSIHDRWKKELESLSGGPLTDKE